MMEITFPGGVAVDATYRGHTVHTDQPLHAGGGDSGPAPFDLFLASIGTCAGLYALRFCQQRDIPTAGLRVTMEPERDDGRIARLRIAVELPPGFPDKYRAAILRAVDQCTVKRHMVEPPEFEVVAVQPEPVAG
jgi:ribosomal protein S12 methylthiotransferase accessory factor